MQRKRTSDVWREMTDRWHLHQMFKVNILEWDRTHTLNLLMCFFKITTAFPWHSCQFRNLCLIMKKTDKSKQKDFLKKKKKVLNSNSSNVGNVDSSGTIPA